MFCEFNKYKLVYLILTFFEKSDETEFLEPVTRSVHQSVQKFDLQSRSCALPP